VIEIYTDGPCAAIPGRALGGVLQTGKREKELRAPALDTNNRMEMTA